MVNVKGKWTLITGAARGIGYLAAQFMAKQGSNLILQSRNIAHTEKILSEVKSLGVEAFAVEAELGCDTDISHRCLNLLFAGRKAYSRPLSQRA